MLTTNWIATYAEILGWQVSFLTLNLLLLGIVGSLIGIAIFEKGDAKRLVGAVSQMVFKSKKCALKDVTHNKKN